MGSKTRQINLFTFRGSKADIAELFNPILARRPKNGLLSADMSAEKMQCIISGLRFDLFTPEMSAPEKRKIIMAHTVPTILLEDFIPKSEMEQMGYVFHDDPDWLRDEFPFIGWKVHEIEAGVEVTCEMWDYEHYDMTAFIDYIRARHPSLQIAWTILPSPEEPTLKCKVRVK